MSWLAEKSATTSAAAAIATGAERGSTVLVAQMASASPSWVRAIQPRRRPKKGRLKRSSRGAHRNLNE